MPIVRPYTLLRMALAWSTGSLMDFGRRLVEPVHGPFDLIFHAVWAPLCSAGATPAVLLMGLVLFIPPLNRLWYGHRAPFWTVFTAGSMLFLFGVYRAHHGYFALHEPFEVADGHLIHFGLPGALVVMFAVCFTPIQRRIRAAAPLPPSPPQGPPESNLDRWLREREEDRRPKA